MTRIQMSVASIREATQDSLSIALLREDSLLLVIGIFVEPEMPEFIPL